MIRIIGLVMAAWFVQEDPEAVRRAHELRLDKGDDVLAQIDSGLWLVEDDLTRRWGADTDIEDMLVGLPDDLRAARVARRLEAAQVASQRVDQLLKDARDGGRHPGDRARRWTVLHGVLAATTAHTASGERALALRREARHLLGRTVKRGDDPSGRSARLLADLLIDQGEIDDARTVIQNLLDDDRALATEQDAARCLLVFTVPLDELTAYTGTLLGEASSPWTVVMAVHAALHAGTRAGLGWSETTGIVPVAYAALIRTGVAPDQARALMVSAVSALTPPDPPVPAHALCALGAAGVVTDHDVALAWLREAARSGDASGDDRFHAPVHRALAREYERAGSVESAREAWLDVARHAQGDESSAAMDEAARLAMIALEVERDDAAALAILNEAAAQGLRRDEWLLALATLDARRGAFERAYARLDTLAPGTATHLAALHRQLEILELECGRDGHWPEHTRDMVQHILTASTAAAQQRRDLDRAALARPVVGRAQAVRIRMAIDEGDVQAARTTLDEARDLAGPIRRRLTAQLAAATGSSETLEARLDDALAHELLGWALGASVARPVPTPRARHARALDTLAGVLRSLEPTGDTRVDLASAEALRLGGRCDLARELYDHVLDAEPSLAPAMLGRAECLRLSDARTDWSEAASAYRALASLPPESAVDRWRLAQLRLLELRARAGVDAGRIAAAIERLRVEDPGITAMLSDIDPMRGPR